MFNFLKVVPLFANLPDADLVHLTDMAQEVTLSAGELLFEEGTAGDRAYIIKEGQLEILKVSGGREVLLAVRREGEVIGEMALLEDVPRSASVRAHTKTTLLAISAGQLNQLFDSSPAASRAMLLTITARWRSSEAMLRQSEKMAQLGTLTAGVAHELNNPAAAAARAASQLSEAITQLQQANRAFNGIGLSPVQLDQLQTLGAAAQTVAAHPPLLDTLAQSDLESELETWLDDQGIENAWELTPALANFGFDTAKLETLAADFESDQLLAVLQWLTATFNVYSLLFTIGQGTGRISEIVKALKAYSYLDQAPVQAVDVREGLDNTLIMLHGKLKTDVSVVREYAPDLPRIEAFGSELNQVWTNIIDNAVDAMKGKGRITIRARHEGQWLIVEIEDNGPGIPAEVQPRVFDPFFTTKPPGLGTGLGLNISYNIVVQKHQGEITVFSQPGKTRFQIKLPLTPDAVVQGTAPLDATDQSTEESLRSILELTKTIAVVGISAHLDRPSYGIAAYLQEQGYRIFPVNPAVDQVLGESAYADLSSIPEPVDLVLIFRQSEAVPPIVNEAIKIGASAVWMQEGIVNDQAAYIARNAGLKVVMDRCMRNEYRRLMRKQ